MSPLSQRCRTHVGGHIVSVEEMIEPSIGRMTCSQIIQAMLVSIPLFFDYRETFISVFSDRQPAWHYTNHTTCEPSSYICNLSKKYGLKFASSFIKGLLATSFFFGCLLARLVIASFWDSSLGHKNLVFIFCLVLSLATIAFIFLQTLGPTPYSSSLMGIGHVSIVSSALVFFARRGWEVMAKTHRFGWFCQLHTWGVVLDSYNTLVHVILCCTLNHFFLCEFPPMALQVAAGEECLSYVKKTQIHRPYQLELTYPMWDHAKNLKSFFRHQHFAHEKMGYLRTIGICGNRCWRHGAQHLLTHNYPYPNIHYIFCALLSLLAS
ncbi:hypothetical protein Cgig2_019933 [Carnegiea gigantea]|uniref:Uncharacterized protein n=1 Tax=Carnegiea gigantea TaxID=171969 RepID=A0A9Q1JEH0_9CARY|nr:hypothetical protein Cgig2_019933 [Carnegiea gigantea]